MSKIPKLILIHVLAFFVFEAILCQSLNAQDVKTLENGLRVIIREDHREDIVVFSAFIDIGSASEREYLGSGISHLVEHMLFKGTRKYSPGAIEDILHKYGGKIEGFTSYDYTGLMITILKKHIDIAMDVLREMLTSPTFNAKELEKEKRVIEREMELTKDDPATSISRSTFSKAYIRHPYRVPVIGYRENFKRLKREDLVNFFKSNYTPERIVIAVAGDINKDVVFSEIENLFGKMHRRGNVVIALPKEPEQIVEKYAEEKLDIHSAYLNIAFHSTDLLNKDLYALDLLSFILGQGESSILNEKIRIREGLVLSISAYNYTPREPGLFIISTVLKEEDVKKAIDEIIKELSAVKERGITNDELLKAKNNFLAEYMYQKETIESQANDLALGELLTGNPCFFELYIGGIKSVTLEDIQRVMEKYLTRDNMTVVVMSKSGNALNLSSCYPIMQKEEKRIEKLTLENSLPVLVSENPSLPIISISLLLKGGLRFETKDTNGISRITSLMLTDGTDSMTREEIARFYESRGVSLNTYSGNNSVGISVMCLKEHLEDTLKLISNLCTESSFPEKELEREKKETSSIIDMQDDKVFNHGHRILKELLFKRHPYRFQTTGIRESIDKIKREDVLGFHKSILSADNMVLGVAGDCSVEEIKALAEKYFSKIPLMKPNFILPPKELPIERIGECVIKTNKEQSLVLLGFQGIDIYSKDRYAIEIMVDVLSSESGILFKNIRGKSGLSYRTGAFEVLGIDPGYIAVYALTSKENIDKVKGIMLKEIASFVKNGVSSEGLEKSKNYLKAMHKMAMETNSGFIFATSMDELYGLGYNNYKEYDRNIDSVTEEDVKNAAEKILTLDKCAVVILEGGNKYD